MNPRLQPDFKRQATTLVANSYDLICKYAFLENKE